MDANRFADVLERFTETLTDLVNDLRDDAPDQAAAPAQREVEEIDIGDLTPDSDVEVNIGNLWRVVNGARYMVRMAREGKVPNMDQRGPLDRALKALKAEVPALRKGGIGRLMRHNG